MDTTEELKVLSLCTGYGGIERGIRLTGQKLRTITHVEIETYAIANLVSKMGSGEMDPCPIWTDVKTLPTEPFRGVVDLLTGGYPCQPFSNAGKRRGEDDPRHLWPHISRLISDIRPRRCFFENVEGHISMGLSTVISDLEDLGYAVSWGIFSAKEVGAPHQRKRVFILADTCSSRLQRIKRNGDDNSETEGWQESDDGSIAECYYDRFPSGPGSDQNDWEEPRTIESRLGGTTDGPSHRIDRLRLLGNGVVPQTAALAWNTLSKYLHVRTDAGRYDWFFTK